MQPQSPHDRHASGRTFAHCAIQIGQHSVAKLEILTTDGFDLGVVKVASIGNGGAIVVADLNWTGIAGVPSPRQTQLPGAAVTAKQRAERSELKPAQVKFRGELLGGDEATDVCAPIRNAAEPSLDSNRTMRSQRLPTE